MEKNKSAYWIYFGFSGVAWWECSNCNSKIIKRIPSNICSNCNANMIAAIMNGKTYYKYKEINENE